MKKRIVQRVLLEKLLTTLILKEMLINGKFEKFKWQYLATNVSVNSNYNTCSCLSLLQQKKTALGKNSIKNVINCINNLNILE